MKNLIAGALMALTTLISAPTASANPDPVHPCMPTNPCEQPQYCPDTGEFVVGFESCPALVTGPYAPGGLQPNEGSGR